MANRRFVVLGTVAGNPYAGMAWMHMQIAAGLSRLGHDVYYMEVSSAWPYDPIKQTFTDDSSFATDYLQRVTQPFGLGGKWGYRRSYSDGRWLGLPDGEAAAVLAGADAVFNVAGATALEDLGSATGPLIYLGTDPGWDEIGYANDDDGVREFIDAHSGFATYAENLGGADCLLPGFPSRVARTRQPVLTEIWSTEAAPRPVVTTVANWRHEGRDVVYNGETYTWSKHHEFLRFVSVPAEAEETVELATGISQLEQAELRLLERNGWRLVDGHSFSTDPWPYLAHIQGSLAEFTVAKDLNVRLRTGWFSERSACYLAAGRPVVTQDTGFGAALPTDMGLLAYSNLEEAVAAIREVVGDYERHAKAAREIANEYFRAETVLGRLLSELGLDS